MNFRTRVATPAGQIQYQYLCAANGHNLHRSDIRHNCYPFYCDTVTMWCLDPTSIHTTTFMKTLYICSADCSPFGYTVTRYPIEWDSTIELRHNRRLIYYAILLSISYQDYLEISVVRNPLMLWFNELFKYCVNSIMNLNVYIWHLNGAKISGDNIPIDLHINELQMFRVHIIMNFETKMITSSSNDIETMYHIMPYSDHVTLFFLQVAITHYTNMYVMNDGAPTLYDGCSKNQLICSLDTAVQFGQSGKVCSPPYCHSLICNSHGSNLYILCVLRAYAPYWYYNRLMVSVLPAQPYNCSDMMKYDFVIYEMAVTVHSVCCIGTVPVIIVSTVYIMSAVLRSNIDHGGNFLLKIYTIDSLYNITSPEMQIYIMGIIKREYFNHPAEDVICNYVNMRIELIPLIHVSCITTESCFFYLFMLSHHDSDVDCGIRTHENPRPTITSIQSGLRPTLQRIKDTTGCLTPIIATPCDCARKATDPERSDYKLLMNFSYLEGHSSSLKAPCSFIIFISLIVGICRTQCSDTSSPIHMVLTDADLGEVCLTGRCYVRLGSVFFSYMHNTVLYKVLFVVSCVLSNTSKDANKP